VSEIGFVAGIRTSKPTRVQSGGRRTNEIISADRRRMKSMRSSSRSAEEVHAFRSLIEKSGGMSAISFKGDIMVRKIAKAKMTYPRGRGGDEFSSSDTQ
jgi:hypothetical protein